MGPQGGLLTEELTVTTEKPSEDSLLPEHVVVKAGLGAETGAEGGRSPSVVGGNASSSLFLPHQPVLPPGARKALGGRHDAAGTDTA